MIRLLNLAPFVNAMSSSIRQAADLHATHGKCDQRIIHARPTQTSPCSGLLLNMPKGRPSAGLATHHTA